MKTCLLITTFKRPTQLDNSLKRLCNLTLPDEILVVDDGSQDNTEQIVRSFEDRLPIRYIYNHNPDWSICSMARNIGVKNTDADIIITTEPELLWITDIIPQMLEDKKKHPEEIISAGVIYHAQVNTLFNPGLVTDPVSALKDEIVEQYVTEPRPYNQSGYVRTENMQATFVCLYERKWLLEVGGWDEEFKGAWGWDDIDLATRLRIKGVNQHVCPEMMAIHQWHEHLPPHLMGQASSINEAHMIQKKLNEVTERDDPRLVANQGSEWGVINER
jgi:glycosyltransferase involved in cell wall biosynthesis